MVGVPLVFNGLPLKTPNQGYLGKDTHTHKFTGRVDKDCLCLTGIIVWKLLPAITIMEQAHF